ncbi:hypothetical protein L843_3528 [Mycobacterium intracellulare MIN_061107_1834]|nr:hypothetical protein L843_3528 [Mycobacterium intracellulare MIN_061107_1834]
MAQWRVGPRFPLVGRERDPAQCGWAPSPTLPGGPERAPELR